ncbi:hypothetical protein [uncultured Acetobacteroides sp.]|uniref:hypothetical protein n=1 Tax=uncultured Acetobacteroides sp. TaxID=1760811 RepID=UPI0029F45E85|nr:hypothetical protein [uncultured Acetobacteroides sp.]
MKSGKFKYVAMTFAILQGTLLGAYVLCNNAKHSNNQMKEFSISCGIASTYSSVVEADLQLGFNNNHDSETLINLIRVVSSKPEESYRMLSKAFASTEKVSCSLNQLTESSKDSWYSTPKVDLSQCHTSLFNQFRI